MSRKLIGGVVFLVVVVCATSIILISRASTGPQPVASQGASRMVRASRNLSLQPEAVRVNRRLGNKFKPSGRVESTISGSLTVVGNQQHVTIIRRQIDGGESVEVLLPGRRLTWTATDGITATGGGSVTEGERLLLERLVLDSPDQFVLAQLRGASYFTIARNLRPNDAADGYNGPLWTMVRVSQPQLSDELPQKTRWRLYYINETSDLIDRVVSEVDGQRVEAGIQWTERNGEQVPARVTWTTSGQTIMEFEVAGLSQSK